MENNMEKITHMLQAKLGCIWINSLEEMRVIDTIREIAFSMLQKNTKVEVNLWSITEGVTRLAITDLDVQETNEKLKNPLALLEAIKSTTLKSPTKNTTIWILRDFGKALGNRFPDVYRELRDIKEYTSKSTAYNPIIAINVGEKIPQEIEPLFYVIEFDRLQKKEIESIMNDFLFSFSKNKKKLTPLIDETELSRIASALNGLTFQEIASIVKLNMEYENTLSYNFVLKEKIKLIKKTEVLDYIISETTLDDVGGNENFKEWIDFVKASFEEDAQSFGCRKAKGYLSLGIPGTAKSILAEALSNYLGFPFIRFDISKILCRFVGESEKNIENALRLVKASAPCVFLLDEVEKILGSTNSNSTDGGTTSRIVSSILQFLNEDTGVITVMTSNDISQLPPELTRPGRLDKVWYFGLPTEEERKQIFNIHLNKTKKAFKPKVINEIAATTSQYTGAEIELIVKESVWRAFNRYKKDNKNEITFEDLLGAKETIIPIADSYKEKINFLEQWARTRAQYASKKTSMPVGASTSIRKLVDKI